MSLENHNSRITGRSILIFCSTVMLLSGCAFLRAELTDVERHQREQLTTDDKTRLLVEITLEKGKSNTEYDLRRKYLELDFSRKESIYRKFFEIEHSEEENYLVFFLENKGSTDETDINNFPDDIIKSIEKFKSDLGADQKNEYRPLIIQQYKITKRLRITKRKKVNEYLFSKGVIHVEKSNLFGLFNLKFSTFVFFGMNSEAIVKQDYLDADSRFLNYTALFLKHYLKSVHI